MAYIDQDRSREKTISGAVSLAVIAVVGYGLVSGLAMQVIRQPTWLTPARQWKIPAPPPIRQPPQKVDKTAPKTVEHPYPVPPPLPDVLPKANDPLLLPLPPFTPTGIGNGGDGLSQPPQPPSADHTAKATPRGDPAGWVTSDDYPPSAVRAGIEGRTSFRLDIGADGRPTGCAVLSGSGSDDLDRTACRKLMSRARFKPALDASGNPLASTYSGGVIWKLPAE